ncbi:hypothetical protein BDZ89DRAFT_574647 [Hymenopellis radicata]|nr:hypothetical protein BDZ89DRAFT_574647 [Hymenopellis radicata]
MNFVRHTSRVCEKEQAIGAAAWCKSHCPLFPNPTTLQSVSETDSISDFTTTTTRSTLFTISMATNVATPQTTQRALSPRLFLTTDDVKRDILTKWEAQEPFCVRFSVKSDALDELEQMIATLPCSRDLRISYTFDDGLIIRWMPGGAHDAASRAFIRFVDEAFIGVLQPPSGLAISIGPWEHQYVPCQFVCCLLRFSSISFSSPSHRHSQ